MLICSLEFVDSKGRGQNRGLKVRKLYAARREKPLPIVFDDSDQQTFRPVGEYSSDFTNWVGVQVGDKVPLYYKDWSSVPANYKAHLWPQIEVELNCLIYYFKFVKIYIT